MAENKDPISSLSVEGRQLVAREVDRRGFLKCASWAGAAAVWTVSGGVLSACGAAALQSGARPGSAATHDLFFVQISDSHIGFKGTANPDVTGTFQEAINQINALPQSPAFVMHTGDLTHTASADQFGMVKDMLASIRTPTTLVLPGEHDTVEGPQLYLDTFGKGTKGEGWYSFDHAGVHFLSLVNVVNLTNLGHLGQEQIDFVQRDLSGLGSDTPLVVFAHVPLFSVYEKWGWGTDDSLRALSFMRRFASVTVLNGHIHQVMSRVEGNVSFHTMPATAYPLPAPGKAPAPNPVTLPAGQLHGVLGIREVQYHATGHAITLTDQHLR
jgi:Icc protein